MGTVFLVALSPFVVAMLVVVVEAIVSVTRQPSWLSENLFTSGFQAAAEEERRTSGLPFVGADRRENAVVEERYRKAA
jgi:hypothetical protein